MFASFRNVENSLKFVFILTFVLGAQVAQASSFSEDLGHLKYAAQFANISSAEMDRFLDPKKGPESFRLNSKNAPWAGNYFPMKDGGLAHRWQEKTLPRKTLTEAEVKAASPETLQELSPIEKYDLVKGDLTWSATRHELFNRGPLREMPVKDWEGFCNGVRCAGVILPEPKFPVDILSPVGVKVTFEPADIKALLGASYFYVEKYAGLGAPSRDKDKAASQPDPAVFDMALRYNLATKRKSFVVDTNLTSEIWNETVIGYRRKLGPIEALQAEDMILVSSKSAVSKVRIQLTLETLGEVAIKDSNFATRKDVADGHYMQEVKAAYTLYLDKEGRAVGGTWHNARGSRGIDFAWFAGGKGTDAHEGNGNRFLNYSRLRKILKESIHPSCGKLFF